MSFFTFFTNIIIASISNSNLSTSWALKNDEFSIKVCIIGHFSDIDPHSYWEQSKRLFTSFTDKEHVPIDDKKSDSIFHGKIYNLEDLAFALIANPKRLESFDSHLYKFLKSSNFPKSLIGNKHILNQLTKNGETLINNFWNTDVIEG